MFGDVWDLGRKRLRPPRKAGSLRYWTGRQSLRKPFVLGAQRQGLHQGGLAGHLLPTRTPSTHGAPSPTWIPHLSPQGENRLRIGRCGQPHRLRQRHVLHGVLLHRCLPPSRGLCRKHFPGGSRPGCRKRSRYGVVSGPNALKVGQVPALYPMGSGAVWPELRPGLHDPELGPHGEDGLCRINVHLAHLALHGCEHSLLRSGRRYHGG